MKKLLAATQGSKSLLLTLLSFQLSSLSLVFIHAQYEGEGEKWRMAEKILSLFFSRKLLAFLDARTNKILELESRIEFHISKIWRNNENNKKIADNLCASVWILSQIDF